MTLFAGKGRPIDSLDLLVDETTGIAIDATMAGGQVTIKDEINPSNNRRNVPLDASPLVNGGTSPKMVQWDDNPYVRWAPHNLCIRSQEFDNSGAWTTANSSVTMNATTSPDNTFTADKLKVNTNNTVHRLHAAAAITVVNGAVYTVSIYVKAGEHNWICILANQGNTGSYFNIFDGTVGAGVGSPISRTITDEGNGWWRCVVTFTQGSASDNFVALYVAPSDGVNTFTGANTTDGLYIWGLQYVRGYTAMSYLKTTSAGRIGIPQEYNSIQETFGILAEQQTTNQIPYSANTSGWDNWQTTDTQNSTTAPDGSTTATLLYENNVNQTHQIYYTLSKAAASIQYTMSIYAKAKERTRISFGMASSGETTKAWALYDLVEKEVVIPAANSGTGFTALSSSIEDVGNGWVRCILTGNTDAGTIVRACNVWLDANTGSNPRAVSYLGDNVSGVYLWGAQFEAAAWASSYVPTTGATVTRAADSVTANTASFGIWNRSLTKLLLHADAADACTTFTDSSQYYHVVAGHGNSQISTAQSKFGASFRAESTTDDFLSLDGSSEFAFGTGDFVVDLWYRPENTAGTATLIHFGDAADYDNKFVIYVGGVGADNLRVWEGAGGGGVILGQPYNAHDIVAGNWHHIAMIRSSGVSRLFLNGAIVGPDYTDTNNYTVAATGPFIGSESSGNYSADGWFDEIRISKGTDRGWFNGFTVPTRSYTETWSFSLYFEGQTHYGDFFGVDNGTTSQLAEFYTTDQQLNGWVSSTNYPMGAYTYPNGPVFKAAGRWAVNAIQMSLNTALDGVDTTTNQMPYINRLGIGKTAYGTGHCWCQKAIVVPRDWTNLELQARTGRNTWSNTGATALLSGEFAGFAIDATTEGGTVTVTGNSSIKKTNVTLDNSNLTQGGTSPKMVLWNSAPFVRWTPHNLETNNHRYPFNWDYVNVNTLSFTEIAPDGVADAQKFIAISGDHWHGVYGWYATTVGGWPYTASIYAKMGTHRYVDIVYTSYNVSTAWVRATADLLSGTITATDAGATGTVVTSSITNAGNGWYRISITGIISETNGSMCFSMAEDAVPESADYGRAYWTATGGETALFWGMQINRGYQPTTPVIGAGVTIGIPQEYVPADEKFGMLVEPAATNLALQSEAFGTTPWTTYNGSSVANNTTIAPDGSLTAETITFSATSSSQVYQNSSAGSGIYTFSIWAKTATGTRDFRFKIWDNTVDTNSPNITANTTWTRYSYTFPTLDPSNFAINSPVTASIGDLIVWGAQFEVGSIATSYIPTLGSTATRAADLVTALTSTYSHNTYVGSVYTEFKYRTFDSQVHIWEVESAQGDRILNYSNTSGYAVYRGYYSTNDQGGLSRGPMVLNTIEKTCCTWSNNAVYAFALDGSEVARNNYGWMPVVDTLRIGHDYNSAEQLNGYIYRLVYFPRYMINSELQNRTKES